MLTPPVGIVLWAVGARNGFPVAIAAGSSSGPRSPPRRRSPRRSVGVRSAGLSATVGVVIGIVMMTDGVLAV